MRTLKKTLALVLVFAMMIGFGAIGASAAFTDVKADTKYAEEIAVLNGIGAIDGMTKDTFAPDGTLTREQAAKLIAYLVLGPTNAKLISSASSQKFTDVPANRWSAGYIEYCANLGIIAGVGDKKFAPEGKLTTAAFTKMLLVAVGFDAAKNNFVGDSWAINVAAAAVKAGIKDKDIVLSASTEITRAQACRLAILALNYAPEGSTTVYTVIKTADETVVKEFASFLESYLYFTTLDNTAYKLGTLTKAENSLGFKVYSLVKGTGADDFGRPSTKYTASTMKTALLFAKAPAYTFTTAFVPKTLELQAKNDGYTFAATVSMITNGVPAPINATERENFFKTASAGGNGCLVEVYANANNVIDTIVAVNTWLATVTTITPDNAKTTKIDERALTMKLVRTDTKDVTVTATAKTPGFDAVYAAAVAGTTARFLVVPTNDGTAKGDALMVAVPETKTVTATSYMTGVSFTADGVTYKYSNQMLASEQIGEFTPVVITLDAYGYVIGSGSTASAVANHAVVLRSGKVPADWGSDTTYKAELLMMDGTTAVVSTGTVNPTAIPVKDSNAVDSIGNIVSYTVNKGVYTLKVVGTEKTGKNLTVKTGIAQMTFETAYIADAKTVFLVKTSNAVGDSYKAYVGISNVPSYKGTSVNGAILAGETSVATVVYLDNPTSTGITGTDKIFVTGHYSAVKMPGDVTIYVGNALVNGEIKTLNFASEYPMGFYTSMTTSDTGIVSIDVKKSTDITSISTPANGIVFINGAAAENAFGVSADCVVYYYDAAGTITAGTVAGIAKIAGDSATVYGTYTTNVAEQVNAIFLCPPVA